MGILGKHLSSIDCREGALLSAFQLLRPLDVFPNHDLSEGERTRDSWSDIGCFLYVESLLYDLYLASTDHFHISLLFLPHAYCSIHKNIKWKKHISICIYDMSHLVTYNYHGISKSKIRRHHVDNNDTLSLLLSDYQERTHPSYQTNDCPIYPVARS